MGGMRPFLTTAVVLFVFWGPYSSAFVTPSLSSGRFCTASTNSPLRQCSSRKGRAFRIDEVIMGLSENGEQALSEDMGKIVLGKQSDEPSVKRTWRRRLASVLAAGAVVYGPIRSSTAQSSLQESGKGKRTEITTNHGQSRNEQIFHLSQREGQRAVFFTADAKHAADVLSEQRGEKMIGGSIAGNFVQAKAKAQAPVQTKSNKVSASLSDRIYDKLKAAASEISHNVKTTPSRAKEDLSRFYAHVKAKSSNAAGAVKTTFVSLSDAVKSTTHDLQAKFAGDCTPAKSIKTSPKKGSASGSSAQTRLAKISSKISAQSEHIIKTVQPAVDQVSTLASTGYQKIEGGVQAVKSNVEIVASNVGQALHLEEGKRMALNNPSVQRFVELIEHTKEKAYAYEGINFGAIAQQLHVNEPYQEALRITQTTADKIKSKAPAFALDKKVQLMAIIFAAYGIMFLKPETGTTQLESAIVNIPDGLVARIEAWRKFKSNLRRAREELASKGGDALVELSPMSKAKSADPALIPYQREVTALWSVSADALTVIESIIARMTCASNKEMATRLLKEAKDAEAQLDAQLAKKPASFVKDAEESFKPDGKKEPTLWSGMDVILKRKTERLQREQEDQQCVAEIPTAAEKPRTVESVPVQSVQAVSSSETAVKSQDAPTSSWQERFDALAKERKSSLSKKFGEEK